jgi:hypothetical protein
LTVPLAPPLLDDEDDELLLLLELLLVVELFELEPHAAATSASAHAATAASSVRVLTGSPWSIPCRREARRARLEACYRGVASV